MIENKFITDKDRQDRFENKKISELTVKEFRQVMQECFDADRGEVERREIAEKERLHKERLFYSQMTSGLLNDRN